MGTIVLNDQREKESFQILDDAYELGINTFDTASIYDDNAEGVLLKWIAERGLREEIVVLAKGAHHNEWRKRVTPYDIMADISDTLAKPGGDYIDIFMLHRDDTSVPVAVIMDTLNRLYDAGKIRSFGASNWSWERVQEANEYAEKYNLMGFTSVSPHFGLAERMKDPWGGNCVTLTGRDNEEGRNYYLENNIPVFSYSSLGRGFFSGKFKSGEWEKAEEVLEEVAVEGFLYEGNMERLRRAEQLSKELGVTVSQIALAWIFCNELDVFALVSSSKKAHLEANIKALEIKLTTEQCRWLNLEE